MRILLLQFRPDPVMADHESSLILARSGRAAEEFVRLDATRELLATDRLDGVDALLLGGSGDYLISQNDIPSIRAALRPFLVEARSRNVPTLGICFGGQLMTEAFGGTIALDESRAETGTFAVTKTAEGERDPLFSYLSKTFDAQLGHKDHFISIPAEAMRLAASERSPNQAWSFPGEPIYALTFHPELDVSGTLHRLDYYAKEYGVTAEKRAELSASLRESPEANELIARFLLQFVG